MTSSTEIRKAFTDYFANKQHLIVPGGSLIPDDKTLLFTNAGMVPFKKMFTGQDIPPSTRVTSVQKCVRAGGKHNDLDNVGVTARHHTLFEMLGNFSFGDYFKEQAILYAWEFITDVCGISKDKLLVTYHYSDLETKSIWQQKIGLSEQSIIACGDKDNFWSMGATGPCGPCTEIFYDHGPEVAGGPPGSVDEDGDRFVEIWNLVFMQFNQSEDGNRTELPRPCVDTGSGLERLAAVMQRVHDNYDIDQFKRLLSLISSMQTTELAPVTKRVVADHARAIACLINDGVYPSNEGRGYVLRRILRRAACFMYRDGQTTPLLSSLMKEACVDPLLSVMSQSNLEQTIALVLKEEQQFSAILSQGSAAIAQIIASGAKIISGAQAFKLYDTYGLPFDVTLDIATANKIAVDAEGFKSCMLEQKNRSRGSASFKQHSVTAKNILGETEFVGYDHFSKEATVIGLYDSEWQSVQHLSGFGHVVLDKSVFYAESGGQVADTGVVADANANFFVEDAQKYQSAIALSGLVEGQLNLGAKVNSKINLTKRQAIAKNHSATHLLHSALRKILGPHVEQKGSLVNSEVLRFDFSHSQPMSPEQIAEVEAWVLEQVRQNLKVVTEITSFEQAQKQGAMALFEAKYGSKVRLLSMGDVSLELCGGTHVASLAEIGNFAITSETGIAAGVRRITAVTGYEADKFFAASRNKLLDIANKLGGGIAQIDDKLKALQVKNSNLQTQLASVSESYIKTKVASVNDAIVYSSIESIADPVLLNALADALKKKSEVVVLLSSFQDGKHLVIVQSSQVSFNAGEFIKFIGSKYSAKGGGKDKFARGQILEEITLDNLNSLLKAFS